MDKEEYTNIYALYKSEVGHNPVGRPKDTFLDQISRYLSGDKRIKQSTKLPEWLQVGKSGNKLPHAFIFLKKSNKTLLPS